MPVSEGTTAIGVTASDFGYGCPYCTGAPYWSVVPPSPCGPNCAKVFDKTVYVRYVPAETATITLLKAPPPAPDIERMRREVDDAIDGLKKALGRAFDELERARR